MTNTVCKPTKPPALCMIVRLVLATLIVGLTALPAASHHPGEDLDALMGSREKYFQAVDRPVPEFVLRDATGKVVRSEDFRNKVVVLHFVYTRCPDVCPLHAEKIAEIQRMVNATPMRELVHFLTITTDPENDTAETLKSYGAAHGLDPANWSFLTTMRGQAENTTRALAEAFGHRFVKNDEGTQVHGLVTHVIDRNGRWAANFHGLRFAPVNMVLYINGLTNDVRLPEPEKSRSLWDWFKAFFSSDPDN